MALRDLTPDELSAIAHENDASLTDVKAEPNTVYHEPSDRVLSVPQGLDAGETQFVIDRDVDGKKRFFGQQSMDDMPLLPPVKIPAIPEPSTFEDVKTNVKALGTGGKAFFAALPTVGGVLLKEQAELGEEEAKQSGFKQITESLSPMGMMTAPLRGLRAVNTLMGNNESLKEAANGIIERNQNYMRRTGLGRPNGGTPGFMYDLGNGGASSLASLGIAALTKSPAAAAVFFGAAQKSSIYEEAREAGKSPESASYISTGAGVIEGTLEKIGLDHFIPAMRGNSLVKRFINGAIIEGVQETTQQASEEAITTSTGVRKEDLSTALENIAYSGVLGFVIGGGSAATIGHFTKEKAKEAGLDDDQADKFGKYVEENLPTATQDMGEFLRKEVSPLAADHKSADEFITLMQRFNNNAEVVNRADLSERERAVFDEYIEHFNNSTTDQVGVEAVEKAFFDKAITAGVDRDQAVAASKLLGARADAASRALGVSPMEWYGRHNLDLEVQREKSEAVAGYQMDLERMRAPAEESAPAAEEQMTPETEQEAAEPAPDDEGGADVDRDAEVQGFQKRLDDINTETKDVSTKKPLLAWLRKQGGVRAGSVLAGELKHVGINTKTAPGLFRKSENALKSLDNIPLEEFHRAVGYGAEEDGNGYVSQDWLIHALRDEQFGKKHGQVKPAGRDESFIQALDKAGLDYRNATAEQVFEALGPDADIIAAGEEQGEKLTPKAIRQIRGLMKDNPELDVHDAVSDWAERASIQGDTLFQRVGKEQSVFEERSGEREVPEDNYLKPLGEYAKTVYREASVRATREMLPGSTVATDLTNDEFFFSDNADTATGQGGNKGGVLVALDASGIKGKISKAKPAWEMLFKSGIGEYVTRLNKQSDYQKAVKAIRVPVNLKGEKVELALLKRNLEALEKEGWKKTENGEYVEYTKPGIVLEQNQTVLPGAEAISDKELAERKFQERLQPKKAQKGMDEGLFGDEHKQTTLFQSQREEQDDGMGGVRGSTTFSKDRTLIKLFREANASTIFHELGHVFLRDMKRVAADSRRPMVRKDWQTVKEWLGAKGNSLTEEQEEQFARGFEAYLREGKAPKPGLQGVFDRFKIWLESIYKSAKELKVDMNDDIRRVFDRMLGGDFVKATDEKAEKELEDRRAADYEAVAEEKPAPSLYEDTARNLRDVSNLASDAFVPVSTRLGNIDRRLKHAVRRFVFRTGLYSNEDRKAIKGFIEKVSKKFSDSDYRILDLALKNRDTKKVDELIKKYDATAEWEQVRATLDDIYTQAQDVGLDLGYVEDYFPRKVKSDKALEFLAFLKGTPQWGEIQEAIRMADIFGNMTPEERAEVANNYLRGFTKTTIDLQKPDAAKNRTIDYVTPQMNQFYEDSAQTLMSYITGLRHGIESRKLFGKSEKETDKNIGAYVLQLIEEGVISPKQEAELKKILKAVVEPVGTRGFVGWSKNASYIYLMGSPISAITQIQDLAFSLAFNGYYRTGKSLLKSLPAHIPFAGGKIGDALGLIRKEDIGIDNILEEYSSQSRASKAVRATFKVIGLTGMDDIGKEVYINAALSRIQKANKKGGPAWDTLVKDIFGVEGEQFKEDLADGVMSENVKYMLFSELSDVQPISLAEMPRGYLRGGNGRIFYMLKTYTIKQIDTYRRNVISEIASGDPKRMIVGVRNMIHLSAALMFLGMGSDALKDLILGRKIDVNYLMTDNMLKLIGFSKYQIYKSRQEGLLNTFWQTLFVPPVGQPVDDLIKDIRDIGINEKKPLKDAELAQRIPLIGKFYYWWWGGGHTKEAKKAHKPV